MPNNNQNMSSAAGGQIPAMEHFVSPTDVIEVEPVDKVKISDKPSNLWRDAWRDMRRRPMFWIAAVIILVVAVVALFPSMFTGTVDPRYCDLKLSNQPAGGDSLLGYTKQGCDVYARIIHGTATSVTVGFIVILMTSVMGVIIGAISGFYGGFVDSMLSRLGDIFFAIPYILAAIVIMSVFSEHRNVWVISLAIGAFAWPSTARIMRAEVLRVKNQDFVTAAEAMGLSRFRTMARHVLPNSIAPVIVVTTLSLAGAIVAEATLSFLGVGLPSSQFLSWGNEISAAQFDLRNNPSTLIWPSLALTITVLGFIMMGEVVRDALDPKARARR
ncbi:ABC transporter permease [Canibacter zhuwentaonis]|uniref:ABC transporter permease n=1 Tax=Canibacter zhuwentaonis TaxID=2837491 RepID=UPI002028C56C|nr:ABC transporter permease [Canibacter zhuwentaonis]